MPQKEILNWKSKVQYRSGTPYIGLIKHLSKRHSLQKGNKIECKLITEKDKLKVLIEID